MFLLRDAERLLYKTLNADRCLRHTRRLIEGYRLTLLKTLFLPPSRYREPCRPKHLLHSTCSLSNWSRVLAQIIECPASLTLRVDIPPLPLLLRAP